MPDKRQGRLIAEGADRMEKPQERLSIDKAVSLTYDSDPKVRLKAAQFLSARHDDPRSIFALIELSGDKDPLVSDFARQSLGKVEDPSGTISSLEQFFAHKEEIARDETATRSAKEKLMPSIEKLFSRMDGKKASRLKQKLMPSIEKLFSPRFSSAAPSPPQSSHDPLSEIEKMHHSPEQVHEQATTPASALLMHDEEKPIPSSLESIIRAKLPINPPEHELAETQEPEPESQDELERDMPLEHTEEYQKASFILDLKNNIYQRALDLASVPGTTAKMLKEEEKKLFEQAKEQIRLAFRLATLQARGREMDRLSNLDYGHKRVYTKEAVVVSVESVEYGKGRRPSKLVRIVLSDASGRIPLYLSSQRGSGIQVGDFLKLEDAYVEASPNSGEKALFIARKGRVIVIK